MLNLEPSPITSRPPRYEFTDRFIQPPSAGYTDANDRLVVEVTSTAATTVFRVQLRILKPGERILDYRQDITIADARTTQVSVFPLPEGFILGLDVSVPAAAAGTAWNYARVGLARGPGGTPDVFHGLVQGYIDVPYGLFWPGGQYQQPADGLGLFRSVAGADPAAGAEASITVPTNSEWLVRAAEVSLVTDATSINRRVLIRVDRGAVRLFVTAPAIVQTASTTFVYVIASWGESGDNRDGRILVNWPPGIRLQPGDVISTNTIDLQAGDNLGEIRVQAEEWFRRTT